MTALSRPEQVGPPVGPTTTDHLDAAAIATAAGELLLDLRDSGSAGRAEGRAVDLAAHALIVSELSCRHPGDAVLSEEDDDDPARLDSGRVWIVDPLDGTREFNEPGRDDWAVHVALVMGGSPVAGAVALPARGMTLATPHPKVGTPRHSGRPRLVVSRSRPTPLAASLARALDAELLPMGSAGAKAMAVVLGEADVYAHSGGQFEWDSAAPVAVAAAAGLHASRLDGSPLRYNRPDPWLPDLLICRPELAPRVLAFTAGERR